MFGFYMFIFILVIGKGQTVNTAYEEQIFFFSFINFRLLNAIADQTFQKSVSLSIVGQNHLSRPKILRFWIINIDIFWLYHIWRSSWKFKPNVSSSVTKNTPHKSELKEFVSFCSFFPPSLKQNFMKSSKSLKSALINFTSDATNATKD